MEAGEEGGEPMTILARLEGLLPALESWTAENPGLESPPELPANAPRVRFTTSRGDIVVGLYSERAPQHTSNFLKLCGEGFYDNTLFHRVLADRIIQGGDPNSRDRENPGSWGLGGPDYTIPPEISDAWHFEGSLAAAKKGGESESSGSQFYITATDTPEFDEEYTVFGRVLEGLELVKEMASEAPANGDRPEDPVVVEATTVL